MKHTHWQGFPAEMASNTAPVLVFFVHPKPPDLHDRYKSTTKPPAAVP